jgi:hypothetical protein
MNAKIATKTLDLDGWLMLHGKIDGVHLASDFQGDGSFSCVRANC